MLRPLVAPIALTLLTTASGAAQFQHWESTLLVLSRADIAGPPCSPQLMACDTELQRSHALGRPATVFRLSGFSTDWSTPCTSGVYRATSNSPGGNDVFRVDVNWGQNQVGFFDVVMPNGPCPTNVSYVCCSVVVRFDQSGPPYFDLSAHCTSGAIARQVGAGSAAQARFEEGPSGAPGSVLLDLQQGPPLTFADGLIAMPVPWLLSVPVLLDATGTATIPAPEVPGLTYYAQGLFLQSASPLAVATSGVLEIRG